MQHIVRGPFQSKSFGNDLPVHIHTYMINQTLNIKRLKLLT